MSVFLSAAMTTFPAVAVKAPFNTLLRPKSTYSASSITLGKYCLGVVSEELLASNYIVIFFSASEYRKPYLAYTQCTCHLLLHQ